MALRWGRQIQAVVLLVLVLMQAASFVRGQSNVRLCVVGPDELKQCEKLLAVLAASPGKPSWICVQENDREGCVLAVGNSVADTMVAAPGDIVHAYLQFGMRAALAEVYSPSPSFADVAIVDKALCDAQPNLSLADLAGKRACFAGYRDDAGWDLLLGVLVDKGILQPVNQDPAVANDIETVEAFFSKVCAPGPADGERVCSGCIGDCSTAADIYSGQEGALQCVSDKAGDVAFLRSDTLQAFQANNLATGRTIRAASEFRYLCPGGGCQSLDQGLSGCYLAPIPASALLTRRFYDASAIQATLTSAAADAGFQALFMNGSNPAGLIFSPALSGFQTVTATQLDYVGPEALRAYEAFDTIDGAPLQTSPQTGGGAITNLVPPPYILKWCTTSEEEQAVCLSMAVILRVNVNPHYVWGCVQMPSLADCILAIQKGIVDFVTLDGGDVFLGSAYYQLKAFVSEVYSQGSAGAVSSDVIRAVAVVKKELCDANPFLNFAALQGKTSCHPYYRQEAGWVAPVGFLLDSGFLPTINTDFSKRNDLESVQTFFARVCAPGNEADSRVCSACAGNCSMQEPFAGDAGALNCLMNGGGDVAWVDANAVTNYAKGGPLAQKWANTTVDGLRLLCPDVGCVEVGRMTADCVLASVPPRAVVTRGDMAIAIPGQILLNATRDKAFQALFLGGTNTGSFVFRADTRGLAPITTSTDDFLGASTLEAYSALFELDAAPVATNVIRWCLPGRPEYQQCLLMLPALQATEPSLNWQCILRNTTQACIDAVTSGDAEVVMLDGNHMFEEVKSGRLTPTVSESYDELHSLTYRAVAVVRKEFCDRETIPTLKDLRGKNSCHGSTLSAYGWTVPVGDMLRSGAMSPMNGDPQLPNDIESVEQFFGKSCAPGEVDSQRICTACPGDCGLHTDPYFGTVGAFRCLMEGAGDVAFVRHTTPGEYAQGGPGAQPWSTLPASEFRLLCPSGGCAAIGQEATCAFTNVPGASLLARPNVAANALALLQGALARLGDGASPHFNYLFEQSKNTAGLIFDYNLHSLNPINETAEVFLASTSLQFASFGALSELALQQGVPSKRAQHGLGAGAIVGIVFGVLGGVMLILGASFFVWKKKFLQKNRMYRYERSESKLKLTAL
ncbi:hypothetical protein KFL_003940020 [Klebsormidium nitens]|uniref:Transferrin-like domain-containing protein n=1 Tax=Klebsormidium nitens TaxID=105231 RepID=A0A1Y1IFX0_KLENI|nr:hypothetical protein KFL_003940020 [Klebsormidium nitens]|eukprot:GAQ88011.1 hypothetical protein KFL_003940020 [Klebsormidium nitens]